MSEQHKISEYINKMSFKKKLGVGFSPDEVYEAIYDLTNKSTGEQTELYALDYGDISNFLSLNIPIIYSLSTKFLAHPKEIKVTLEAAKAKFKDKDIIAIFKPNTYSRTRDFKDQFYQFQFH